MIENKDIENQLEDFASRLETINKVQNIAQKQEELKQEEAKAAAPDFWNDAQKAKEISKKIDTLKTTISSYQDLKKELEDNKTLFELALDMQ